MTRHCGPCTLCCTVMGVVDLKPEPKPAGTRCPHECSRGCRVYQDRPKTCGDFECIWLQGAAPKAWRPDKVGFVLNAHYVIPDLLVVYVDPARPEAWRRVEPELQRMFATSGRVLIGPAGGRYTHQITGGKTLTRADEPA